MAADADAVRRGAMAELARRELARRELKPNMPSWQQRTRAGMTRIAGATEALASLGSGTVATPAAGIAGVGAVAMPGGRTGTEMIEDVSQALTYEPRSPAGKEALNALSVPGELIDRLADKAGGTVDNPLASTAIKTGLLAAPILLGLRNAPKRFPATARPPKKPPTTERLKEQAQESYKAAEDAGVIISDKAMNGAVERIVDRVANEGIDATLHPDSMAALNRLMEATGKQHSLKGADILRQVIKDAEASTKPADRRMASIMRREFDDFIEGIGPDDVIAGDVKAATAALTEARSLYARNRKAESIENLMKRAQDRAPQFSGSGYENALRTEFRQLAMNEKKMRRFSVDEQAAIRKVARGGPIENALRMLGKAAPTGIVSTSLSAGLGGIVAGPMGAVGLPLAGGLARQGATALTGRNARMAAELMRRGGRSAPQASLLPNQKQLALAAALAQQEKR